MAQILEHRGPDGEGIWAEGSIGLGSRRLSIIDPPGGAQPMTSEDGTLRLVANGEIYNHMDLRQRLKARGHRFRSRADVEVILHLYEEEGAACVEALEGMFAFALWDASREQLVLARDRLGQKPLFLARDGDSFLFASEVKALLAVREVPPRLDEEALAHYLTLRFVPPPSTLLQGIEKVPPAHVLVLKHGEATPRRYWHLSFEPKMEGSPEELLQGLRQRLIHAVESHLMSDVPVGAFLSGGVDSSLIIAVAARELGRRLPTFAIGVEEAAWSELPFARRVAEQLGTEHHEELAHTDLMRQLPAMIWHLDEPSDPIAPCIYSAATLAARHVKVVLGGDGGDELFAGFDRYWGLGKVDLYRRLPLRLRYGVLSPLIGILPDHFGYKNLTQRLRWVDRLSRHSKAARRYAEATSFFRFGGDDRRSLFGEALHLRLRALNPEAVLTAAFEEADADHLLDSMLYTDYLTRLPEHSLMLADRLSMAHRIEQRSPLLDHRLVEYVATLPVSLKMRGRQLKVIGRRLLADYLPQDIVRRPKHGFMLPVAEWLRGELHPFLGRVLLDSHFVRSGLFRRATVERLLGEHRRRRADHHVRLWMLLNLEVWHRLYIEQTPRETVTTDLERVLAAC